MNGTLALPVARTSHAAAVLSELIFVVGAFAVTVGLAAANGGYFPTSWGWSALALFFAAAAALLLRTTVRLGRFELVFLGSVTVLVGWTWLSSLWSIDLSSSVLEGQRGLVLIGAVVAVLMLAPPRPVKPLLGPVCTATTVISAYALATRLFPGRVGSYDPLAIYRLNTPIGYWNGLGVFAAIGAVLALGFAARGTRAVTRGVAAASFSRSTRAGCNSLPRRSASCRGRRLPLRWRHSPTRSRGRAPSCPVLCTMGTASPSGSHCSRPARLRPRSCCSRSGGA